MMIRTKLLDCLISSGLFTMDESEPLSKRVDPHHVSAPERPTITSFFSASASSNANLN